MIHRYLHAEDPRRNEHWASETNGIGEVLFQLQDQEARQVRVRLSPDQAEEIAVAMLRLAEKARGESRPPSEKGT